MNSHYKYLLLLGIFLLLSACQGDEEKKSSPTPPVKNEATAALPEKIDKPTSPEKKVAGDIKAEKKSEVKVEPKTVAEPQEKLEEPAAKVDLQVSGEYLEKIDEESEDYLKTPPPPGETVTEKPRKVELSGDVILGDKEEDLTRKVDGGKVKIKIPID